MTSERTLRNNDIIDKQCNLTILEVKIEDKKRKLSNMEAFLFPIDNPSKSSVIDTAKIVISRLEKSQNYSTGSRPTKFIRNSSTLLAPRNSPGRLSLF
ncbi:MAG: hypothetical protein NVSMB39_2540 [Candidatus Saccharimonadales bacterium]